MFLQTWSSCYPSLILMLVVLTEAESVIPLLSLRKGSYSRAHLHNLKMSHVRKTDCMSTFSQQKDEYIYSLTCLQEYLRMVLILTSQK